METQLRLLLMLRGATALRSAMLGGRHVGMNEVIELGGRLGERRRRFDRPLGRSARRERRSRCSGRRTFSSQGRREGVIVFELNRALSDVSDGGSLVSLRVGVLFRVVSVGKGKWSSVCLTSHSRRWGVDVPSLRDV